MTNFKPYKWSLGCFEICPDCGEYYDGSYCQCHEDDLGD